MSIIKKNIVKILLDYGYYPIYIGMAGHRVPMFHGDVMNMLARVRASKQAGEASGAIDLTSRRWSPARRSTWARPIHI